MFSPSGESWNLFTDESAMIVNFSDGEAQSVANTYEVLHTDDIF